MSESNNVDIAETNESKGDESLNPTDQIAQSEIGVESSAEGSLGASTMPAEPTPENEI